MLKKRIIPCLDIRDGRTVKGIHFAEMRDAGDPVELAKRYVAEGADELVFLDITATVEKRRTLPELVQRIAREINIPFTVGGGIDSIDDVQLLVRSGADKISLNSAAVIRPQLITEIAAEFGNQCVVVAIDTNWESHEWRVYTHGGRRPAHWNTIDWAKQAESLGAGEILLTSMNRDGTKSGFALDITKQVAAAVNIPVIASGGAGEYRHFKDLFRLTEATGALAASIFHYGEVSIPSLKERLQADGIAVRAGS